MILKKKKAKILSLTKDLDEYILSHAKAVKEEIRKNKKALMDIPFERSVKTIPMIKYILTKSIRNENDFLFLQHFLTQFKALLKPIASKSQTGNVSELLNVISKKVKLEIFEKNKTVCNYGDQGDKFYMIFSGKVSILVPKEKKVEMTNKEYYHYLSNLISFGEVELALKVIDTNIKTVNPFFVYQIKKKFENENRKTHKRSPSTLSPSDYVKQTQVSNATSANGLLSGNTNESIHSFKYEDVRDLNDDEEENVSHKVIAYEYFQVATLENYATFGEVALSSAVGKRTATVIAEENAVLGSLGTAAYKKCIKASQEMIRKREVKCIISIPFFSSCREDYFETRYFNYFRAVEMKIGDTLFSQGEKRESVFLIKKGEVEISTYCSVRDINRMIGRKHKAKDNPFKKYFTLLFCGNNEAVGLEDMVLNETYFVTAKCLTQVSLFVTGKQTFLDIVEDSKFATNYQKYIKMRKIIMVERLKDIKSIGTIVKKNMTLISRKHNNSPLKLKKTKQMLSTSMPKFKLPLTSNTDREREREKESDKLRPSSQRPRSGFVQYNIISRNKNGKLNTTNNIITLNLTNASNKLGSPTAMLSGGMYSSDRSFSNKKENQRLIKNPSFTPLPGPNTDRLALSKKDAFIDHILKKEARSRDKNNRGILNNMTGSILQSARKNKITCSEYDILQYDKAVERRNLEKIILSTSFRSKGCLGSRRRTWLVNDDVLTEFNI